MKITICGSNFFYDRKLEVKEQLEQLGHDVEVPPTEITGPDNEPKSQDEFYRIRHSAKEDEEWVWSVKESSMRLHFDKVAWADVILVLNYNKNHIEGYVGANTLIDMGLALHLKKNAILVL